MGVWVFDYALEHCILTSEKNKTKRISIEGGGGQCNKWGF